MQHCDEIDVLAHSPLVAAGIQIANMVLKGRIRSARNISELQTRARAQGIDFY